MRDLPEVLADLAVLLEEVEVAVLTYTDVDNLKNITPQDGVDLIDAVAALKATVKTVDKEVVRTVGKITSRGTPMESRSGQLYEKKVGQNKKKWQHQRVRSVIAEKLIEKHTDEDGVLDAPLSVIIVEAFNAASVTGYKSTICKPLGVDVNQFCKIEEGNVSFAPVKLDEDTEKEEESDGDFI